MTTLPKFHAVRDDLNTVFVERETAINNALLALATGNHYLMLGPPGTGKSLLVRELVKRIEHAAYFEKLMNDFTVPEEVLGPIDLIGLSNGNGYRRITTGSLLEAQVAFLDEVYKANSAILNALLGIMNERLVHEVGHPPCKVPLVSLFAASNETPQDDSLKALDDRFLFREVLGYIGDEAAFTQMILAKPCSVSATITLDDIQQAQTEADATTGTGETLTALIALKNSLSKEGVIVSDRKWKQSIKVLKANAWLDGRPETSPEDLSALVYVLWNDPKDRATVEMECYRAGNPLHLKAVEYEDKAQALIDAMPHPSDYGYHDALDNTAVQLSDIHTRLQEEAVKSLARDKSRTIQALDRIAGMYKPLGEELLKQQSRVGLKDLGVI